MTLLGKEETAGPRNLRPWKLVFRTPVLCTMCAGSAAVVDDSAARTQEGETRKRIGVFYERLPQRATKPLRGVPDRQAPATASAMCAWPETKEPAGCGLCANGLVCGARPPTGGQLNENAIAAPCAGRFRAIFIACNCLQLRVGELLGDAAHDGVAAADMGVLFHLVGLERHEQVISVLWPQSWAKISNNR